MPKGFLEGLIKASIEKIRFNMFNRVNVHVPSTITIPSKMAAHWSSIPLKRLLITL